MEQGSSEKSQPNQRKQLQNEQSLGHEQWNPQLHSSPQELSYRMRETNEFQPSNHELINSLQRKQTQQVGTSFSRAPLRGELLPQFGGGYEDFSASYLHANSHDQQLYNLPLLNQLPPEFYSLSSSSRLQGENIGSSQTLVQFGSSAVDPSIGVNSEIYSTLIPSRNQDNPYSMNIPSEFDLGNGSSNNCKSPTTSTFKRKMTWQDDRTPTYRSWNFPGGYPRYSSRSFDAIGGRYSLYDKRYEDIGLPVDPHLRIFNATNGNGNGESTTQKT